MDRQIIVGARTIAMPGERVNSTMLTARLEGVIVERGLGREVEVKPAQKPKAPPENKAQKPAEDKSMGGRKAGRTV